MARELKPELHIARAMDSITVINETVTKTKTDELVKIVEANYKHIEVMLGKDWFASALTIQQKLDFDTAVSLGKSY